jgi:hypothetical protein
MKSEETALALRSAAIEPWRHVDWQRLWLSVQTRHWKSLAIVPAGAGAPPDFALTIATTLARTGMMHLGVPIQVADATQVRLANVVPFTEEVRRYQSQPDLLLLALAPIAENPVMTSLAQSADCSLLSVLFESMASADAKKTVSAIGKERFLGAVTFRLDAQHQVTPA